jgi:2-polyprenyl-3-methyl-5-hydroxy-6-metoxy-1,4-benzoquinol methylase
MSKTETIACNLCGKKEDKELYIDSHFRVVICSHCSLVYLNPRMSKKDYRNYYLNEYQFDRHEISTKEEAIERIQKKNSYKKKAERFEFMRSFLNKDSKVFEIGAGMGTQLKVINDLVHCTVEGIELSALGVQVANEHYGLSVKNTTLEDYAAQSTGNTYSFVILHHVLEHFLNPTMALRLIHSFTEQQGKIYIAVPNLKHPDEPLDRFFRLPHTYYFSINTLTKMLQKTGWKIVNHDVGKQEIRIIAEIIVPRESICGDKNEVESIRKIILIVDKKYTKLRKVKDFAHKVLPKYVFQKLQKLIIKILRKLGVITV